MAQTIVRGESLRNNVGEALERAFRSLPREERIRRRAKALALAHGCREHQFQVFMRKATRQEDEGMPFSLLYAETERHKTFKEVVE